MSWNAICDSCGFKFKSHELRRRWDEEHNEIIRHTTEIHDFRSIESLADYPRNVRKFIRRAQSVKAEQVLRRLL